MMKIPLYILFAPFIGICLLANFIVWGQYDAEKRRIAQQRRSNLNWLEREIGAERHLRDQEYQYRRKIEELEEALRKEQKSKKR